MGLNMARPRYKLSDKFIKSANLKAGRYSDGGGLYLKVTPSGTKFWVFMWSREDRRREMGFGAYPAISLATAREFSAEYRTQLATGLDPITEKRKEAEPTFGDCSDKYLATIDSEFRNDKHRAQWKMTLKVYCEKIRSKKVSQIETDDVLQVLTPIWQEKRETASRLRGRIERVLDFAKVKGWRIGENPALWRGHLQGALPSETKTLTRGHHAAMAYADLPDFLPRVRSAEAMAARALEFLILTAARSGEVLGAKWSEVDFEAGVWTVPAERMKAGKEHRVPLVDAAVNLLRPLHDAKVNEFIFPGHKPERPLSNMSMEMLLRRMKVDVTVHGFRSSFRDWVGDRTTFPRELAEAALAHKIGDAVEQAYRRSDALAKRKKLMKAWADFVSTSRNATVIAFEMGAERKTRS
ncbi:tyrosine-type recombinase/integrase [Phyllobacterium calauticae]|uniref:tyrosine-type recombinase/integrase n=1 Tax=Phyllobacterium calauticae TaxID=2817027 RepID=UPI0029C0CF78|nr:integrase arm-type DNA-binding domain-containing protein [Phyllobacterium calauticae]